MAGSFGHMTKQDGTPYNDRYGEGSMLENGGDVVEALRQCYGMIWWLADAALTGDGTAPAERADIMTIIEEAIDHNKEGIARGSSGA
jgi:hypothetical protein